MSNRRGTDAFSQMLVGIFMSAVIALLVYFTVVISGVDVLMGREKTEARIAFESVGGLKDHDNVMYRGTKVGQVQRVEVHPENLVVVIEIDKAVVLRENCKAVICSQSMLGGNFMTLEEGEGEVIDVAKTLIKGETPTDWMRDMQLIAANIRKFTEAEELKTMIANFEKSSAAVKAMTERVERGEGTLGKLLSSDDVVYRDIAAAVSNANIVIARLRDETMIADFKRTIANAAVFSDRLRDEEMIAEFKRTVANAAAFSDRLQDEEMIGGFKRAVTNVAVVTERMKSETLWNDIDGGAAAFRQACEGFDFGETKAKIEKLVANLTELTDNIKSGKGTFGRLANDPGLYDKLDGLLKDARQVLDNYRDTAPITTFGSLATGAL